MPKFVEYKNKIMNQNIQHTGLNEVQIGLLRMFDRNIPETDIREIKQVLVKHLSKQLLEEVDKVVEEKGITEANFKRLETEHFRTKSKKHKLV
jgi:hypothetical protein